MTRGCIRKATWPCTSTGLRLHTDKTTDQQRAGDRSDHPQEITGRHEKILIIYTEMIIGGATSALLSLLHSPELRKIQRRSAALQQRRHPARGNPQRSAHSAGGGPVHPRILAKGGGKTPVALLHWGKSARGLAKSVKKRPLSAVQVMTCQAAKAGQKAQKSYDTAVSFLEFWPLYYLAFRWRQSGRSAGFTSTTRKAR